jgi:hypothetical protein
VEELVDGDGAYGELMEGLRSTQCFFQYFLNLLTKAEARLICAGGVIEVRENEKIAKN